MAVILAGGPAGEGISGLEGKSAMKACLAIWLALAASSFGAIPSPQIPGNEYPIARFGAVPDGTTSCTVAIRNAVDACAKAGGGVVVIPEGRWLTGPFVLQSNMNLR